MKTDTQKNSKKEEIQTFYCTPKVTEKQTNKWLLEKGFMSLKKNVCVQNNDNAVCHHTHLICFCVAFFVILKALWLSLATDQKLWQVTRLYFISEALEFG